MRLNSQLSIAKITARYWQARGIPPFTSSTISIAESIFRYHWLKDYYAAEAGNTGIPLTLEEFKDFAARREAEEHYIKEEIRKKAQEKGVSSHGATKVFKLNKLKKVKENIRRMMALYEAHRRHLYSISKGRQLPVGTEKEDVRYYIKISVSSQERHKKYAKRT
jgi:HEPN domain-containing protein